MWAAISNDAQRLDEGFNTVTVASSQLWPKTPPVWAAERWGRLKDALLAENPDWSVWTGWYEARLEGRPSNETLEVARVLIADGIWRQGPRAVNAEIGRLMRSSRLAATPQERVGNRWVDREALFAIDPTSADENLAQADVAAAADPKVQQLHAAVRRKAAALANACVGLEEKLGWTDFEGAIGRFLSAIDVETSEIPARIATVYDAAIELGSFLEFDNDLREHPQGNVGRLPPDIRRLFTDLIRTSAPWVRSFPSASDLDDQAGAFLARPELFEPSKAVLNSAAAASLISDQDRELILALLAAVQRAGFPAEKAGIRGVQSTRNFIIKAAALVGTFYLGAVSSDFANRSDLVKRTGSFLAEREVEVAQFMKQAPDDIRIAMQELLLSLRRKDPDAPDANPGRIADGTRRRDEDLC